MAYIRLFIVGFIRQKNCASHQAYLPGQIFVLHFVLVIHNFFLQNVQASPYLGLFEKAVCNVVFTKLATGTVKTGASIE